MHVDNIKNKVMNHQEQECQEKIYILITLTCFCRSFSKINLGFILTVFHQG